MALVYHVSLLNMHETAVGYLSTRRYFNTEAIPSVVEVCTLSSTPPSHALRFSMKLVAHVDDCICAHPDPTPPPLLPKFVLVLEITYFLACPRFSLCVCQTDHRSLVHEHRRMCRGLKIIKIDFA